jgi:L-2-hydroxyglutarate oxidase LhgO
LSRNEALALEQLECVAALHSPNIVDNNALMLSLQGRCRACGGTVLNCGRSEVAGSAIDLIVSDGTVLRASTVVNAAGLSAQGWLQFGGLASQHVPGSYYAKGNYFSLAAARPLIAGLPVPEAAGRACTPRWI